MPAAVSVFLVDPHAIYRRGLAECLRALPGVAGVAEAESLAGAPVPLAADVVVLSDLPRTAELVRETGRARVIVLTAADDPEAAELVAAGVAGLLCRETATPEALAAAVQAALSGTTVIAPEILATLVADRAPAPPPDADARTLAWLTAREQRVLSLIADGHRTREVAERLSYSERTVKNVLHDVVGKLGARSRSQAVAHAVRDGLI